MTKNDLAFLADLQNLIEARRQNPVDGSYTNKLFSGGIDKILQKVGEESVEYIIDAKNASKERAISEAADLIYHLLVSLSYLNWSLSDVVRELEKRHGK